MGNCCSAKKGTTRAIRVTHDSIDEESEHKQMLSADARAQQQAQKGGRSAPPRLVTSSTIGNLAAVGPGSGDIGESGNDRLISGEERPQSRVQKMVEARRSSAAKNFPNFKHPLALPPHMRMEGGFHRTKHNSTSSLYINNTLSKPDNDEILRCMANALYYHIEKGHQSPHKTFYEIFSEEKHPITKGYVETTQIPKVDVIYLFLSTIFKAEGLDSECAIMCLAYIERIIALTGITLHASNWRRIVLSALILASKVWEDQSVWNVDFLPVFNNLSAQDLNKLERQFLALIQYNVSLQASLYAKYYFELRTFSKLDADHFPLKPLDKEGARRLEDHSMASEYRVKNFKRSASVDQLKPVEVHGRAVLN